MTAEGRTLVVLGSERGAGKTLIACALLERIRTIGHRSIGIVPIETGCSHSDNHDLVGADGARLRASSSGPVPPLINSPYRFAADADPRAAAARSGIELTLDDLASAVDAAAEFGTLVVVEGPHTALTPLTEDGLTVELATRLKAPVLVVATSPASAKESVEACRAHDARVAGVLLNRTLGQAEIPDVTVFPSLGDLGPSPDIAAIKQHLATHGVVESLIEALRPA